MWVPDSATNYRLFDHEMSTIDDSGSYVDGDQPTDNLESNGTMSEHRNNKLSDAENGKNNTNHENFSSGEKYDIKTSQLTVGGKTQQQELLRRVSSFFEYDPEQHEIDVELGFDDPANPPIPGCNTKFLRWKTRRFVEHFVVRVLTALLILIDMIILVIDLCNSPSTGNDPLEYCSLAFSIYFLIEIILRIYGLGVFYYFIKWYNILDFVLVIGTFALSIITVLVENVSSNPVNLLVILRMIRLLRITRILWQRSHIQTGARQFISQNKRRFQQEGFDLDLTYVSSRIIAMSFPSSGSWSLYRNDIREVSRFLNTRHKDHYRVYNLCAEKTYDGSYFNGNVERFCIFDHNVPTIEEMLEFSKSVSEWFKQDEDNIIAVHCKGGKGRTGTMICVVLIDTDLFEDASHCLGFFGDRRTDRNAGKKFQGVDTPSQSRYVAYYEQVVKNNRRIPDPRVLVITAFTIKGIKSVGVGNASEFTISVGGREDNTRYEAVVGTRKNCMVFLKPQNDEVRIELINSPQIKNDTKVMFFTKSRRIPKGYEDCAFYFWFNTSFIEGEQLVLHRYELDNPHKSKTWKTFGSDFAVTVHFTDR